MSNKRTNAELQAENEQLKSRIAELEDQVANPNQERIAEYTAIVQDLEAKVTAEKAGGNDTKKIAALQSKKSKFNGYLNVLGGKPIHTKRQAPAAATLTAGELQSRIDDLCWERHNILEREKDQETLEGYKRRAVIASDLSKYRRALKKLGVKPTDPVAEAKEARAAEVAAAVEAGENGAAEELASADLSDEQVAAELGGDMGEPELA